jgi:hypothetical protein
VSIRRGSCSSGSEPWPICRGVPVRTYQYEPRTGVGSSHSFKRKHRQRVAGAIRELASRPLLALKGRNGAIWCPRWELWSIQPIAATEGYRRDLQGARSYRQRMMSVPDGTRWARLRSVSGDVREGVPEGHYINIGDRRTATSCASLDVCAPVGGKPHGRVFADPRSGFGFRFEIINVALDSMRKCNPHTPA